MHLVSSPVNNVRYFSRQSSKGTALENWRRNQESASTPYSRANDTRYSIFAAVCRKFITNFKETEMRRIGSVFAVFLIFLIVAAGFTPAVEHLWNWLMPVIFGLYGITYWQALG